jgi:hypothetical protein
MDWKKLLGTITASVDEESRLRNTYVVAENRILRQQINGRVPLTDGDRHTLAELGQKLGRQALAEIATVAKADTILAWPRKFVNQTVDTSTPYKSVGRPRVDQEIESLVVRMARENRAWGYDRIVGALANLGYTISDQTVGNILKLHGIPPAPQRKKTVPWREFIWIHMDVLGATDFFNSVIWARFAFVLSWVLSFRLPDHCLRHVASMKSSLHQWWMLVVPLWSLNMRTQRGSWRGVVNEGMRARRDPCGKRILQQTSLASVSYHHQGVLYQGMGRVVHIPPNLVVRRCRRTLIASRSEDLQVEHPVRCRDATALHFHATLARVQGPALIRDQVVQVRQAGEKRRLTATGMVEAFHGEEFAVNGVMGLVQQRAHRRHLWVFEHRIPARFLVLKPAPHALAMRSSHRRGDVSGKVA